MRGVRGPRRVAGVALLAALAVVVGIVVVARGGSAGPVLGTVAVGTRPSAIAVDERTGRVFVTNSVDFSISVLDASSGRVLRTVAVDGEPGAVAVDPRAGHVFVLIHHMGPNDDNSVDMLDASSGRVLHETPVGASATNNMLAVDERVGRVFVVNSDNDTLSTLDAASGRVLRTVLVGRDPNKGYNPLAVTVDERSGHVFTANSNDNSVSMFDARSGRLLRVVTVPQTPDVAPDAQLLAVDERSGHLFVAGNGLSVLDTRSGRLLHTAATIESDVLVMDEPTRRVFGVTGFTYGASALDVKVLDARSDAILSSVTVSDTVGQGYWYMTDSAAMDGRTGRVFVVRGSFVSNGSISVTNGPASAPAGVVYVLDGHTGRVLYTIPVGVNAGPLAVDGTSGRAFVVNEGGTVPIADPWGWVPSWLRSWLPFVPRPPSGTRTVPASVSVLDAMR